MILIGFAVLFVIVSAIILKISDYVLQEDQMLNVGKSCYETRLVKGTARGSIGNFVSNSMLESMRMELQRRGSKF